MTVTPEWCALMARYNAWQNASLVAAADGLGDAARGADRGAFFGSIAGTLNHVLWADLVWMARLEGGDRPPGGIAQSPALFDDWAAFATRRTEMDARIRAWAEAITPEALAGELVWHSGAAGRAVSRPKCLCVAHFFNHQTHHRGQVHAMLTAAGAPPGDTDLFLMPEEPGR
ncbi:DinB family protein [Roseovarius salinarum]|uniref:DinB family protein n=1 Tax=Roseovarius salinarum TaxID=1981892 RepID=UPI001E31BE61|nr:DinB family protein [Roseovarius salinarum]